MAINLKSKGKNMYNVYNKSNVYFLYKYSTQTSSLIGNKEDLIKFLASAFESYCYYGKPKIYDDSSRWRNKYFDNINMGRDFFHEVHFNSRRTEDGILYTEVLESYFSKEYLFYDGLERIIDVRDFELEAFHYFIEHQDDKKRYRFLRRRWQYQGRASHSKNLFKHCAIKNKHKVRILDSMLDSEYKEYHFKHLEDPIYSYPDWWDDTNRRVEGNWKSQYKVNKQHNIHKSIKEDRTIRKDFYNENLYSQDEIDDMLFDDFDK